MVSIELSELEIKILIPEDNMGTFDCEDEELNGFIRDDALNQMHAMINVTYLCRYGSQSCSIFYFISRFYKINTDDLEGFKDKEIPYKEFSAVKIGRLAVSNNFQHLGVGTNLIITYSG